MSNSSFRDAVGALANAAWWTILIRGVLALLLGILVFATPAATTLLVLAVLFGVYALLDGVVALVSGVRTRGVGRGWMIAGGIVSIIAGVIALVWPGITAMALLVVIAVWAILGGVSQVVHSFGLRRAGVGQWFWLLISGALLAILGLIMIFQPAAGALALVALIGAFLVVSGVAGIVFAIATRRQVTRIERGGEGHAGEVPA